MAMRGSSWWTREASVAACAGLGLLLAALTARPAAAQQIRWAAVAVSPTTLDSGESHAQDSQADADRLALQSCQGVGAKDCKAVNSVVNQCVALAIKLDPNYFGYGMGPTREGAAAQALAACRNEGEGGVGCRLELSPCSTDDVRWAAPLPLPPGGTPGSVDPSLVGYWKLYVNSGIWVWEISVNGTYTFHSEATDGTLPHNGTFTASNGKYTLHSVSMQWDDQGTYTLPSASVMVGVGKLGKGTWYKIASDPGYVEPASKH